MKNRFFEATSIAPDTWLIIGPGKVFCYLVQGRDKALLIDTLCGVGRLGEFVRQLTDKPLLVANTHGHFDHCCGNFEFDQVYIHPADGHLIYDGYGETTCADYVRGQQEKHGDPLEFTQADRLQPKPIDCIDIGQGDCFDLGGRVIEVVAIPGHTYGSVCFLDRTHRLLFAGDGCNCNTLLFDSEFGEATSVQEYGQGLLNLKAVQDDFDRFLISHGDYCIDKHCIDEAIQLCAEILARTDDAQPGVVFGTYPCLYGRKRGANGRRVDGGEANIGYTMESIFKKRAD